MKKSIEISKYVYLAFLATILILAFLNVLFPAYNGFISSLFGVLNGVFITLILLRIQINKDKTKPLEISKHVYLSFTIAMATLGALHTLIPNYQEFIQNLAYMLIGVFITLIIMRIYINRPLAQSNA